MSEDDKAMRKYACSICGNKFKEVMYLLITIKTKGTFLNLIKFTPSTIQVFLLIYKSFLLAPIFVFEEIRVPGGNSIV